ncbi:MAG: DUF1015 family protein, partial [Acidimicrobiales bacterium]
TKRVDMKMVISPPYDIIDPAERKRLAGRHSANSVRVELPEADHRAGLDKYAHAHSMLDYWQQAGTLVADPAPCFYGYRMTPPGGHSTHGVIGALAIEGEQVGDILPHEQTLPKPKSDRLDLLRATRANLSPIWALSLTRGLTRTFIAAMSAAPAPVVATDDDGVLHEMWVINDDATIDAVRNGVDASGVVVADGHHRYETALAYRRELAAAGNRTVAGADRVMTLVVELSDEQLEVGPVHRVLSGLPEGIDLVDAFSSWFDVTRMGDLTRATMASLGDAAALSLVMASGAWLLSPKDGTPEAAGASLDSSMVALAIAELPHHRLDYCYSWEKAAEAIGSGQAQAVVLLRPVGIGQISEWAHAGKRMPPKSTYFHPKPRTGMVFRPLPS